MRIRFIIQSCLKQLSDVSVSLKIQTICNEAIHISKVYTQKQNDTKPARRKNNSNSLPRLPRSSFSISVSVHRGMGDPSRGVATPSIQHQSKEIVGRHRECGSRGRPAVVDVFPAK